MAGGAHFLRRVMNYVADQLIVEGLANSTTFQRFAVRSSKQIDQIAAKATKLKERAKDAAMDAKDAAKEAAEDISESFKNRR